MPYNTYETVYLHLLKIFTSFNSYHENIQLKKHIKDISMSTMENYDFILDIFEQNIQSYRNIIRITENLLTTSNIPEKIKKQLAEPTYDLYNLFLLRLIHKILCIFIEKSLLGVENKDEVLNKEIQAYDDVVADRLHYILKLNNEEVKL